MRLMTGTARRAFTLTLVSLGLLGGGACGSFDPVLLVTPSELHGVQTKTIGDVTVSVGILRDEQAIRHFDADLAEYGLQALWICIRNASRSKLWLLPNAIDPDLYPADEVALLVEDEVPSGDFERLEQHLRDESIRLLARPGMVTEGFLYLPRHEGGRYIDVRLAEDAYQSTLEAGPAGDSGSPEPSAHGTFRELRFGFALPLPDGDFDYERLDTTHTYPDRTLPDLDTAALRAALEELPCCTTDSEGEEYGDPLNVVVVGESVDVLNSLSRSGWSFTHRITLRSVTRMIGASIQGEPYPVAPVSSLYLFGRPQDFALQRARASIARRNHMRLWLAPFTHEGRQVWVGQVSRDIGIKITSRSPTLTTHVVDPEVDVAREYLLHSLLAEGLVDRFGFVRGSRAASRVEPAYNLTADPYFSDGMRLVVMLSVDPVPYGQVRSLLWEQSGRPIAEGQSEAAERNVRPIEPLEAGAED